ncbi:unnamed protein product [Linum trigynum]|uniref:Uncharacterized protein n=1 Tax=Linum trigynum TaxID=586398 RepID=A0AAV2DAB8_9ROSI
MPLAGGGTPANSLENLTGQRRSPSASSSPNPKGDREAQQSKKRVKQTVQGVQIESDSDVILEDVATTEEQRTRSGTPPPSVWNAGTGVARRLFSDFLKTDEWYVADSDSEDVAEAMREDGMDAGEEADDDPLCPNIPFTAAEER